MSHYKREKELRQLKMTIKTWESEFSRSNLRKPQKEDIQSAPSEIKEAYKNYWNLKNKLEMEKFNKEDVWSEKLNKSYREKDKLQSAEGILKKYCNKIRARSCDLNKTNIEQISPEKEIIKKPFTPGKMENDTCNKSACDTANCDSTDLDMEFELEKIKPIKKIMKRNTISKQLKSINALSPAINLKGLERKLSFETSVNSEWLERCSRDTVNKSHSDIINNSCSGTVNNSCSDIVNNSYSDVVNNAHSDIKNNSHSHSYIVNSYSDTEMVEISTSNKENSTFDKIEQLDLGDKLKCSSAKVCETKQDDKSKVKSSGTDPLNFLSDKEVPFIDKTSTQCSTFNHDISTNGCMNSDTFLDAKDFKTQTPIENETHSVSEGDTKSRKRKLAKTINSKLSTHLERKMASGTLNENYVRVNIKKKKFSRGHRSVNVRKLKWQKWKELKKLGSDVNMTSPSSCFKCGQVGHWARNCKGFAKSVSQIEDNMEDLDDVPLPTLEEAADLAKNSNVNLKTRFTKISNNAEPSSDSASLDDTTKREDFIEVDSPVISVKPLYETTTEEKIIETPSDVWNSLKELGYTNFRNGQERAVMRILSGLSTLVVLPTGSGKSLCYQLPAYMYAKQSKCITLVISPLVSLMEDQVTGLPDCLHAICLHSGMTDVQKKASLEDLREGKAHILLVSPEAVIGGLNFGSGMQSFNMPPIAFACIDEVHCLSQWSHNFRPSYLQLYKVLTERFNVKCILGLTATANKSTAKEIISHLGLKSIEESVIGSTGIPENLHLSVSKDKDRDKALIQLLTGDRFSSCSSIIIYCIRRDETERLATLIRTLLQDKTADEPPMKKKKPKSKKRNFLWTAEAYHAGLAPPRRRSIQKQFMTGKLRVIIATIAFGMGLDKRDVRAIIHYNMPKSFESYVQEIGRAGRDGLDSHCHLFLDNEGKDIQELRRFIYSNSTDRYIIRKLLKKVFLPCQCKASAIKHGPSTEHREAENENEEKQNGEKTEHESQFQVNCPKHEIAFSINETVQELDMKEENILTLLCYLELHTKKWIEVLSPTYSTCSIRCYGGPKQLRSLALKSPVVAAAFALDAKRNVNLENISNYEFDVVQVASVMGWNTSSVKRSLKNLEWNDQKRKTGAIVEFSNLSFHLRSPGNLSDDELDEVLDYLYQKVVISEKKEILNLKSLYSIFSKYSHNHYWACSEEAPIEFSKGIKEAINEYFEETGNSEDAGNLELECSTEDNSNVDICDIRYQIRDIIYTNNDQNFTGRAIARIFHGIGSPCFPPEVWGRVRRFWRCLLHVDFNLLIKLSNEELKTAK